MSRLREQSRLEALLESVRLLHSSLELDDLVRHLLRSGMGRLMARSGFIALEQPDGLRFALVRGTSMLRAGEPFDEGLSSAAEIALLIPIGDATHPVGLLGLGKPPGADSIRRRRIHARARQRGGERHCQCACAYGNDPS